MEVMPRTGRFGSVLTAMVTPFDAEGRLDVDGAVTLARLLVEDGNDALVVAGTTGEAPVLSDAEKIDLWRAVAEAVTVPVIAGTGTNDTAHSIELTAAAGESGAAAVLAVTPFYSRPSQAGIAAHFRAIAARSSIPVVLYDIPVRSGRKISHDVLVELATEVPNIVALKDAAADPAAAARLHAAVPAGFDIYSGDDALTLPLLAIGAVGVISVAGHWAAGEIGESIRSFLAGDVERARAVNAALLASYAFETGDDAPNPLPAKAMLRVLGRPGGGCRLPMGDFPPGLEDRAKMVLADLDAWRQADGRAAAAG
jgi:4-hydroxy-tetrahydrodipicolinate synthase